MADETLQVSNENAGGAQPATANGQAPNGELLSAEQLRAEVERLRRENAERRVKGRELEDKLKTLENEKLTAEERARKEAADALEAAKAERVEARKILVEAKAERLGFHDPGVALQLIGDTADIETALQDLAAKSPYLVKSREDPKITTPAGNPPRGKTQTIPPFDPKSPPTLSGAFRSN